MGSSLRWGPVSYTHLDVYKRQTLKSLAEKINEASISFFAWRARAKLTWKVTCVYSLARRLILTERSVHKHVIYVCHILYFH